MTKPNAQSPLIRLLTETEETDRLRGENDRLIRVIWAVVRKCGGKIYLSLEDAAQVPAKPRVIFSHSVEPGALNVTIEAMDKTPGSMTAVEQMVRQADELEKEIGRRMKTKPQTSGAPARQARK